MPHRLSVAEATAATVTVSFVAIGTQLVRVPKTSDTPETLQAFGTRVELWKHPAHGLISY